MADSLATKTAKLAFEDTFDVLVGKEPNQKRFTLHSDVFLPRSRFFRSARSSRWTTAEKPTLLPDDNPELFSAYVGAVYTNNLPKCKTEKTDNSEERHKVFKMPVDMYILADKLQDVRTSNLVIDSLIKISKEVDLIPTTDSITHLVYEKTPPGSTLRQLLVDFMVYQADPSIDVDNMPFEMMAEIFREARGVHLKAVRANNTWDLEDCACSRPRCYYHVHDEENPEAECK